MVKFPDCHGECHSGPHQVRPCGRFLEFVVDGHRRRGRASESSDLTLDLPCIILQPAADEWRAVADSAAGIRGQAPSSGDNRNVTLYERLGGVFAIATVVDDFIDRVMADPRLNANPRVNEAHHKVPPAGFKYLVTEQVCAASGGPQRYTGRSMHESHAHLAITASEWEAFLDDLRQTLDTFRVPTAEQAELTAIVQSTRNEIVTV